MRRKLLALLTVLCLVLGTLPPAAMAADAAAELGYNEDEIAMYVSENTEITEDQTGLVLVVAPAEVNIKGAKLTTGLLVAPGAEGAKVTLGENTEVNAVIVMAASEVVVGENASAVSVTVAAPDTQVLVAGSVQAVAVTGDAVGAAVTVTDTAAVAALEVAAPGVTVEVSGSVETITVADTAGGVELVVSDTAVINTVADATGELAVSGSGAAGVRVESISSPPEADAAVPDAEDTGKAPVSDSDVIPPVSPELPAAPEQPALPVQPADPGLSAAPLADRSEPPETDLFYEGSYGIEVTPSTEADRTFHVVIKAEDLVKHSIADGAEKHAWVGLAIPVPSDTGTSYSYYLIRLSSTALVKESLTPNSSWTSEGVTYDTFYFNTDSFDGPTAPQYQIGVVAGGDALAEDATPAFILDLAFEVTHAAEEPAEDSDPADPPEPIIPEDPDNSTDVPIMPGDPDNPTDVPIMPEDPDNPTDVPIMPEDPDNPTDVPIMPGDPRLPATPDEPMDPVGLTASGGSDIP